MTGDMGRIDELASESESVMRERMSKILLKDIKS